MFAAISPVVYICATLGTSNRPFSANLSPPVLLAFQNPVLLSGGVGVVASCGQTSLHHLRAIFDEGVDHIGHNLCALEQLGQSLDGVVDFDHRIIGRFNSPDFIDNSLNACLVTPRSDEGEITRTAFNGADLSGAEQCLTMEKLEPWKR